MSAKGTILLAMLDTHRDESRDGRRAQTISTTSAFRLLEQKAAELGFRYHVGIETTNLTRPIVTLWDFGSYAVLPHRIRRVSDAVIAWSLESPLVAHRAYHRLPKIAREASAVITFSGAQALLGRAATSFVPILYPNEPRNPIEPRWESRDLLCMINSNKSVSMRGAPMNLAQPYRSARRLAAAALHASYGWRREWSLPDLYHERLNVLRHFAGQSGFSLYGPGWDRPPKHSGQELRDRISRSYKGVARDKLVALSKYRFVLCYENTVFPGYVTEKVFDAFFAGSIPIYLGAPDIEELIPSEAFLDAREFSGYSDIERRIRTMTPKESAVYLDAARDLVTSHKFKYFSDSRFVEIMLDSVDRAAGRAGQKGG